MAQGHHRPIHMKHEALGSSRRLGIVPQERRHLGLLDCHGCRSGCLAEACGGGAINLDPRVEGEFRCGKRKGGQQGAQAHQAFLQARGQRAGEQG
ncbi:MAG: hypothetical protein LC769_03995 [Chloroflexi bacterium]|nr:hypothetical protein [Chloroflexota bacterium]